MCKDRCCRLAGSTLIEKLHNKFSQIKSTCEVKLKRADRTTFKKKKFFFMNKQQKYNFINSTHTFSLLNSEYVSKLVIKTWLKYSFKLFVIIQEV